MKPVAIQLYSVRDLCATDWEGTVRKIAEIGYVAIEGGADPQKAAAERAFCDGVGLRICSGHAAMPTQENAAEIAKTCGVLGMKYVVSGVGPDDVKTLDGIRATAARFQAASEAMAPHGITFAFHNHWWEFLKVGDVVPYDMIMELAPDACSQLDVYWCAFGGGDPVAELKKKGSRVPLLHVKDGPLTGDPPDPHTAVGHGKLDMPAIIGAADPKVLEWLIVELDFCKTDMMQAVVDSYTYLTSKGLASGR